MTDFLDLSFSHAKSIYSVANTPLFVVNQLRANNDVHSAAKSIQSASLRRRLNTALKNEPKTLRAEVAPYLYVVIAGIKGDIGILREVSAARYQYHRWFGHMLDYILKTTIPQNIQSYDLSGQSANLASKTIDNRHKNVINLLDLRT